MTTSEEIVDALIRLRALRVIPDVDEEIDRIELIGDFARLLGAEAELGEANLRWVRQQEARR